MARVVFAARAYVVLDLLVQSFKTDLVEGCHFLI